MRVNVNRKFITVIILFLSLSLVGSIVMQALWINNEWKNKRESFDRDVQDALNRVAERLENQETASFISQRFDFGPQPGFFVNNQKSNDDSNWRSLGYGAQETMQVGTYSIYDLFDTLHKQSESFMIADSDKVSSLKNDSQQVTVTEFEVGGKTSSRATHQRLKAKSQQFNRVLNQLVMEWSMVNVPIEQRVDIYSLHDMISEELIKKGIRLPFQFGVVTGRNSNICNVRSTGFSPEMIPASFSASLFPNDITFRSDRLMVFFDDVRPYIIRSLWWMILLSALMLLIFVATFLTAIYVILKQKKLSEIKTDFINNMTHEFKTPIATISLALDSINNPRILDNKEKIHYYTDIIGRENKRMNSQVENILQMALLDKENFELNEQLLNVNDLIAAVAEPFQLQVSSRGGRLNLDLKADNPFVLADEIHLTNVFHNLLDNANKYSPDTPDILVNTHGEKDGVIITVADRGIGMSTETQKKIFEKFYREQNGNVHNVKGFGLGLAYVKSIITKHGGSIQVKSESGKGTRFIVKLPYGHLQKSHGFLRNS